MMIFTRIRFDQSESIVRERRGSWDVPRRIIRPVAAAILLCTCLTVSAQDDSLAGPRSLSRAFRSASKKAMPSVITVFAYGQNE
ncbi:MAG: hypothetical protein AAFP69_13180, partial [Planctomycetota bacterium]